MIKNNKCIFFITFQTNIKLFIYIRRKKVISFIFCSYLQNIQRLSLFAVFDTES